MAFNRPSLKDIVARVKTDFNYHLKGENETLRFTLSNVFSIVIAGVSHLLHSHLEYITKMFFPTTAQGKYLEIWGSIFGVNRKLEAYSYGYVDFSGSNGYSVGLGVLVKGGNGVEYKTEESGFIDNGTLRLKVVATKPGKIGNLSSSETLSLVNPIIGIGQQVTISADGLQEGTDREKDDDYRARIIERIRNPISGGTKHDYKRWTLELTGVTRAWVFPLNQGPGTVGVTFVQDNNTDIIPTAQKVSEVFHYIEERRPITAEVNVFPPVSVPVDFTIKALPDTPEVRLAIESELKDLIRREAEPGGKLLLTHIREAISIASGENDHELINITDDIHYQNSEIPVYRSITWL